MIDPRTHWAHQLLNEARHQALMTLFAPPAPPLSRWQRARRAVMRFVREVARRCRGAYRVLIHGAYVDLE